MFPEKKSNCENVHVFPLHTLMALMQSGFFSLWCAVLLMHLSLQPVSTSDLFGMGNIFQDFFSFNLCMLFWIMKSSSICCYCFLMTSLDDDTVCMIIMY